MQIMVYQQVDKTKNTRGSGLFPYFMEFQEFFFFFLRQKSNGFYVTLMVSVKIESLKGGNVWKII